MEIVWSCTSWVTQYQAWWMVFHCCRWSVFYCFFSSSTLLELNYGGRVQRSWVAWEQAKEMGTLSKRIWAQNRCQAFPQQIPPVGVGDSSLVSNPAQDVFTCCWERAERGRMYGPPGQHTGTWPRGWPLCHGVGGVSDIPQRNLRHLLECLSAMETTRTSLLWRLTEKGNDLRYPLFPKRPVA